MITVTAALNLCRARLVELKSILPYEPLAKGIDELLNNTSDEKLYMGPQPRAPGLAATLTPSGLAFDTPPCPPEGVNISQVFTAMAETREARALHNYSSVKLEQAALREQIAKAINRGHLSPEFYTNLREWSK